MSSNQNMDIVLVIDTNVLHEKADNGCNFCEFKFNKSPSLTSFHSLELIPYTSKIFSYLIFKVARFCE